MGCHWDINVLSVGSQWDANKPSLRCPFGMSMASHACTHRRSAMPMTCQEAKFRLAQLRSHCHVSDIPLLSTPLLPAVFSPGERTPQQVRKDADRRGTVWNTGPSGHRRQSITVGAYGSGRGPHPYAGKPNVDEYR
jgi:hypothetical protein